MHPALALLLVAAQSIAPELTARDIVNAADLSAGSLSPGEIVLLHPAHAGPDTLAGPQLARDHAPNDRLATTVGDTRVFFNGIPAPLTSSIRGQIGAVVPYELSGQNTAAVTVEYQGALSRYVTLPVVATTPAIFTLDGTGQGQAAILNETGCCNAPRNPATRGAIAVLYATGAGQTNPRGITGKLANNPRLAALPVPRLPLRVTVGGKPAAIVWAGQAPQTISGLLQVNFRVPLTAAVGDAVPLILTVGATPSAAVTMAIRPALRRIVLVDNDQPVRDRIRRILAAAGYEVVVLPDEGATSLRAQQLHPDLVIVRVGERTPQTRAPLTAQPLPVKLLAVASTLTPQVLRTADLLGAEGVLTMPLSAARLRSRVGEALRSHPVPYMAAPLPAMPPQLPVGRTPH